MNWLIVGADRNGLRLIVHGNGQLTDIYREVLANTRNELALIEAELDAVGLSWQVMQRIGVIELPHSHTSVRITKTLAGVSGWFYGQSIIHIPATDLKSQDIQAWVTMIKSADTGQ